MSTLEHEDVQRLRAGPLVEPETRYAVRDGMHIAYQVVGSGELDLVVVSAWFSHVEAHWDIPGFAHYLRRLASFSRTITFDKCGIGLSDPVPLHSLPPLETWMDDVRTVMDAVGSERAALLGANEGAMMAALFAATYPERTSALVLANGTARLAWAPDYPAGIEPEAQERVISALETNWGRGEAMAAVNPSIAGDRRELEMWGRFLRLSASPATAAAVMRMLFELDIRGVLSTISVPTLVVNRRDATFITAEQGRYIAERIPGARFVEVPGVDYGLPVGDVDAMFDEVERFLTGTKWTPDFDRVLTTILFIDIVESTEHATRLGDLRWRQALDSYESLSRRQLARYGGVLVNTTGDGMVATFDGPARAIQCSLALREAVRGLGIRIRAGLHTGEIERHGERVAGLALHIAARIQAQADPDQVLVSRTVKDLVAGARFHFTDLGAKPLRGVPDPWQLYAIDD